MQNEEECSLSQNDEESKWQEQITTLGRAAAGAHYSGVHGTLARADDSQPVSGAYDFDYETYEDDSAEEEEEGKEE